MNKQPLQEDWEERLRIAVAHIEGADASDFDNIAEIFRSTVAKAKQQGRDEVCTSIEESLDEVLLETESARIFRVALIKARNQARKEI